MVDQAQILQMDTARMAYLFSMQALSPRKGIEQDWVNSYNRYIRSFFMSKTGSNSLDAYIKQQTNTREKDPPNTDILLEGTILDVLLPEFLVGMLHLVDALAAQPERLSIFLKDLYSKNPKLRRSLCAQLNILEDVHLSTTANQKQFEGAMKAARNSVNKKMDELNRHLKEVSDQLILKALPGELIALLEPADWKNYLTATDTIRLGDIQRIIKRFQDYFASPDFENRADCLRVVIQEVNGFCKVIQDEPTEVSYDIFLPRLNDIASRLSYQQDHLYKDFQPKLTWTESIQPFRTPQGHIHIQLTVENGLNNQSADQLAITSVHGKEIVHADPAKVREIQSLRGGERTELALEVDINEVASKNGSFTMTIVYTYKCNDSPHDSFSKGGSYSQTYIIRNETFIPIKNPFKDHEGKAMEDESMFFGRSRQIGQIVKMICPDNGGQMNYGRAIAMYGQTRTGKTSLIYHLKQKLLREYGDRVIVWDIGNIGEIIPESPEHYLASFLYTILDIGRDAIEGSSIAEAAHSAGLEPPLDELLEEPVLATVRFNAYMKGLNKILKQTGRIIVFFADEFTYLHSYIKEGKIPSEFMRFWKAFLQNYCIFSVVAGQDDMPEFIEENKNEFACMELMKLTYLEEQDAKKLIQQPLGEDLFQKDGAVDELYELTAGSAYLTIVLCSHLVEYLNDKGAYLITKGIVDDFLQTKAFGSNSFLTSTHFEAQMQDRGHREFDQENREILLSIARNSQTATQASIQDISCGDLSAEEIQKLVDRLEERNVLYKDNTGKYQIQVKLLERWLVATLGG